ncbi:hypothetical protein [Streptomyces sp. NPDC001275]
MTTVADASTRVPTRRPVRDLRGFWRVTAAVVAPLPALAVAVDMLVVPFPPGADFRRAIAGSAAHLGAARAALWLSLVFVLLMIPATLVTAWTARRGAPRLALYGGLLTMTAFAASMGAPDSDQAALVAAEKGLDPGLATALDDAVQAHPVAGLLTVFFLLGQAIGLALLGLALWRGRVTHAWVGAALAVSGPAHLLGAVSTTACAMSWVVTAVGYAGASVTLLRTGDDDFDLPPAGRELAAADEGTRWEPMSTGGSSGRERAPTGELSGPERTADGGPSGRQLAAPSELSGPEQTAPGGPPGREQAAHGPEREHTAQDGRPGREHAAAHGGRPGWDARTVWRVLLAVTAPVAALIVTVGRYLLPYDTLSDQPRQIFDKLVAATGYQAVAVWTGAIGPVLACSGVVAVVWVTRRRAPVLTTAAVLVAFPGYTALFASRGYVDILTHAVGTRHGLDRETAFELAAGLQDGFWSDVLSGVFVIGHLLGTVLLGLALWRARVVPVWLAVGLTVAQPIHLASVLSGVRELDLVGWGLTAVGFVAAGRLLLRMPDDEFDLPPLRR